MTRKPDETALDRVEDAIHTTRALTELKITDMRMAVVCSQL